MKAAAVGTFWQFLAIANPFAESAVAPAPAGPLGYGMVVRLWLLFVPARVFEAAVRELPGISVAITCPVAKKPWSGPSSSAALSAGMVTFVLRSFSHMFQ